MKSKIIVFLLCFFVAFNSFAEKKSDSETSKKYKIVKVLKKEKKLDLVDILNIALKNNPQIKESWLNIETGKRSYNQEFSNIFPTIKGGLIYSKSKTKYDDPSLSTSQSETLSPSISLSYLLFDFGGRTANIMKLKYKLNSIKFETNSFIQNFIYNVIEAYYNLFSSMANEKAAKESENSSYQAYKAANVRYKIGLAPLADRLQAETSYTQKKLAREKAENDVKIKKAGLNYLLNLKSTEEIDLKIPSLNIEKSNFDENIADLIGIGLKNRPDLKAYYQNRKAKKAELYNAKTEYLPSVSLSSSYSKANDLRNDTRLDGNNYSIGITASMPFFTGGYIYNGVAKTKSELSIINQKIEDLKKSIEVDIWTAYQNFITAKKTYLTSQTLLKSAIESEKTMLGMYKNGKSSILDLLSAQSDLANARYEIISAQYNWFISKANLMRSLGQMNEDELEELNESANPKSKINNN